jgi:hypothetical protein
LERERGRKASAPNRTAIAAGTALGATVLFASSAEAATFTVTKLSDDGTDGTLRKEIDDADASPGADSLVFDSSLSGAITLGPPQIIINESLTIQGPGAGVLAIDGNGATRIFHSYFADTLSISGLTLRDGYALGANGGGALYAGDSDVTLTDMVFENNTAATDHYLYNGFPYTYDGDGGAVAIDDGDLTVTGSSFTGNIATGAPVGYEELSDGGAIRSQGDAASSMTISDSDFSQNYASHDGGAIHALYAAVEIDGGSSFAYNDAGADGGALSAGGATAVTGSGFSYNSTEGGSGGAIHQRTGGLQLTDSVLNNNYAVDGGGVTLGRFISSSTVIEGSTLAVNFAERDGAGVNIEDVDSPVEIRNSTLSGNDAERYGGGIAFDYDSGPSADDVAVRNSTIAGNVAADGGGVYRATAFYAAPGGDGYGDNLTLSSTIVADNTGTGGPNDLSDGGRPYGAFLVDFSLIEAPGDAYTLQTAPGTTIFGLDPQLGPRADNGGPTPTHLPAPTSPAIDAGTSNGQTSDQRNQPRTVDQPGVANASGSDGTDIGSAERGDDTPPPDDGGGPVTPTATCQGDAVPKKDGSAANDTLTGTEAKDALFGLAGNDALKALGGDDCLSGDEGNDKLKGGAGKDQLKGGAGNDKLVGGAGKDKYAAAAGADKINAVDGNREKLNCGGGEDKATVDAGDKVKANCETVKEKR